MAFFSSRQIFGASLCSLFFFTMSFGMEHNNIRDIRAKYKEEWRKRLSPQSINHDTILYLRHVAYCMFSLIKAILGDPLETYPPIGTRDPYPNNYNFLEYLAAKEARGWHHDETIGFDPIDYYDSVEGTQLEIIKHRQNLNAIRRLTNQQIDVLLGKAAEQTRNGEGLRRPLTWFYDEVKRNHEENQIPYFIQEFEKKLSEKAQSSCIII